MFLCLRTKCSNWGWKDTARAVEMCVTCAAIVACGVVGYELQDLYFDAGMIGIFLIIHCFRLWRVFPCERRHALKEAFVRADAIVAKVASRLPPAAPSAEPSSGTSAEAGDLEVRVPRAMPVAAVPESGAGDLEAPRATPVAAVPEAAELEPEGVLAAAEADDEPEDADETNGATLSRRSSGSGAAA